MAPIAMKTAHTKNAARRSGSARNKAYISMKLVRTVVGLGINQKHNRDPYNYFLGGGIENCLSITLDYNEI